MAARKTQRPSAPFYAHHAAHLTDELRKLDILIRQRVTAFRQQQVAQGMAATKGLYISHTEVEELLDEANHLDTKSEGLPAMQSRVATLEQTIADKIKQSAERGIFLPLPHLAQRFSLSHFEWQTVVVCLAPELRRKYDILYAYLQDDITRKRPSVDLILELLCPSEVERWQARTMLADHCPLFRHGILHNVEDPRNPSGSSGLGQFLQIDQHILQYLLGGRRLNSRLAGYARVIYPVTNLEETPVDPAIKAALVQLTNHHAAQTSSEAQRLVLYLHGPYGVGKRDLALGLCSQWHCPLLYIDMELLLTREIELVSGLHLACREAWLLHAPVYIDHIEALWHDDARARGRVKALAAVTGEYGGITCLAGERPWPWQGIFDRQAFCAVQLPLPAIPVRRAAWERDLARFTTHVEPGWIDQLASQFRLTPGQIHDAAVAAEQRQMMQGNLQEITLAELYAACRRQSQHKLSDLATRIEPNYDWEDLVLAPDRLQQLQEICSQVRYRQRVFGDWGFARKLSHGKGLSALFVGPSGTGKTMAAEVMAHELQVDLYKIDLSGVVSKYIGETEKNLSRIFHEAEASNAILFFDEADALFGKRTKVSDAHDRYANIETSYLLQRIEVYEGIVILATNLRDNMDEAFTRRMQYVVEFPFPDAHSRQAIWQTHFPPQAPVGQDVDYAWLAQHFQITGGHIKNIVLNAAFFAAADGGVIGMTHVLHGVRREFAKIGKLWNDRLFAQPGK